MLDKFITYRNSDYPLYKLERVYVQQYVVVDGIILAVCFIAVRGSDAFITITVNTSELIIKKEVEEL